jgi:hypothetical protein
MALRGRIKAAFPAPCAGVVITREPERVGIKINHPPDSAQVPSRQL